MYLSKAATVRVEMSFPALVIWSVIVVFTVTSPAKSAHILR
jgi:hypothetical protein